MLGPGREMQGEQFVAEVDDEDLRGLLHASAQAHQGYTLSLLIVGLEHYLTTVRHLVTPLCHPFLPSPLSGARCMQSLTRDTSLLDSARCSVHCWGYCNTCACLTRLLLCS